MYYDKKLKKEQTESQLKRRGLLKPEIDLSSIGIFPLVEDVPEDFNEKIHVLSKNGYEPDGEKYKVVWDINYHPLEQVQTELYALLAEKRWQKEIGGLTWEGHKVDTDRDSQSKITAEYVAATNGLRVDGEYWKMKDGECVPLANNEAIEMASAVRSHVATCFAREAAIKAAIGACTDSEGAYMSYQADIGTGWPETVAE